MGRFEAGSDGQHLPPLLPGVLLKRYKRFLADVRLETGEVVTAHCPNSGSMKACAQPGRPVYLSQSINPKRKLSYTWELIHMPESLVGVNTLLPNRLVYSALVNGEIPSFNGYTKVDREVGIGNHTRIDLLLSGENIPSCYVEVKNCTWVEAGIAQFPDAVTERGRKHMKALEQLSGEGYRSVVFFLIQRMDARVFRPARQIDPAYATALMKAADAGVEIMAYDADLTLDRVRINRKIALEL